MNILVVISGSIGHYHGIRRFFTNLEINDTHKILYAFHGFSFKEEELEPNQYFLNSFPAFLNYEFRYTKKPYEIFKLKRDEVILKSRISTFRKLFEVFLPDIILLDNHAFTDGFLIKKEFSNMQSKVVFFQTRLSTKLGINTSYGSYSGKNIQWISSNRILFRQKLNRTKYSLMMPGYSKYDQLHSYMKGMQLQLDRRRYGLPSISNIPEIILSGKNLSNYVSYHQHYMGLCIPPITKVDKKCGPIQIIISAGSLAKQNRYFSIYFSSVQKLIDRLTHFQFVLPEGITLTSKNSNISFYSWEEYQHFLSFSHIHITHGGINSIKDSFTYGVPCLICPLDWESDSIHNALMFNDLMLSKIWNIHKDTEGIVVKKLEELLDPKYSERIEKFISQDNSKYTPFDVANSFYSLTTNERWLIKNWR